MVAVTARRNAGALAQIARAVGAELAVVADPAAYGELKEALGRQRRSKPPPARRRWWKRRNVRPTG